MRFLTTTLVALATLLISTTALPAPQGSTITHLLAPRQECIPFDSGSPFDDCINSASSHLTIPFPILALTTLINAPRTLAAAIPSKDEVLDFLHLKRSEPEWEEQKVTRRNCVDNGSPFQDCSSASTRLSVPFPIMLLGTLARVPGTLAAAIPSRSDIEDFLPSVELSRLARSIPGLEYLGIRDRMVEKEKRHCVDNGSPFQDCSSGAESVKGSAGLAVMGVVMGAVVGLMGML